MIKNIIFDFGGVLYDIDYQLSSSKLESYSQIDSVKITLGDIIDLPTKFEKGQITESEFRNEVINQYKLNCNEIEFDKAWNAMLLGIKAEAPAFLDTLKSNYNIVLLSNTNSIHFRYFYPESSGLLERFSRVYLSFEIGMRKPDIEIYKYVCENSFFEPSETLFIDDNLSNLNGALRCGLQIFHFQFGNKLSDILHSIN